MKLPPVVVFTTGGKVQKILFILFAIMNQDVVLCLSICCFSMC